MTMSHKEALRAARETVRERMASMSQFLTLSDMWDEQDEIHFRAYLDARGLVMVPREATEEMIGFGWDGYNGFASVGNKMRNAYRRMLASAPDPFGGE